MAETPENPAPKKPTPPANGQPRPAPPSADELGRKLQGSLSRRRFSAMRIILAALVVSVLLLGGLALWLYPRAPEPALQAIALDGAFRTGTPPVARARLLPLADAGEDVRLGGRVVVFVAGGPPRPGEPPHEVKTESDERGWARADWPAPAGAGPAEYLARHVDIRNRRGSTDRGRLFVWPKESTIVLIDIEEALAEAAPPHWNADTVEHVKLRAGAAEALRQFAKENVRVALLAAAAPTWPEFGRVRTWAERRLGPPGPVFGRLSFAEVASTDAARRAAVAALREQFDGPLLAVAALAPTALAYRDLKVRPLWLGADDPPLDIPRAATWSDVPAQLRKLAAQP